MLEDLRVTVLSRGPSPTFDDRDDVRFRIAFGDPGLGAVTVDFDSGIVGRHEQGPDLALSAVTVLFNRLDAILSTLDLNDGPPIPIHE